MLQLAKLIKEPAMTEYPKRRMKPIKIKKSKIGSFTEWCNRRNKGKGVTQKCMRQGKQSPNPAIRKKANFALNSRAWNRATGNQR